MSNLKGKKLLILAGASVHCKVVETAREMGVYTIVTDYLDSSPAKVMADEQWNLNIFDVDGIVERCRTEKVDGVLNFCIDPAQRPYYEICERLGLPCYGTKEQFHILTDKPSFKKFCTENGLDTIPEYSVEDVESEKCEYPIFIKPTDSRGSRGQTVCYSKDEALAAIAEARRESTNNGVVIEKFMYGCQDFSMTYFVRDGVPYLTRTCDRYLGKPEDKLNKQCVLGAGPSKFTDLYLQKVHERVVDFIKALGLKTAPIFMQGFVDGDTVRFYDPGLRFPGGEYERLLKEITGVNIMSYFIEFALTGKVEACEIPENLYMLNGCRTIQVLITARPGKIAVLEGVEEVGKNPKVTSIFTRYDVGECVPDTGDVRQRVCEVAMTLDESDSVSEAVRWIQSQITILDENGNDMRVSLVDPEILDY